MKSRILGRTQTGQRIPSDCRVEAILAAHLFHKGKQGHKKEKKKEKELRTMLGGKPAQQLFSPTVISVNALLRA
mgnify:CR=1 FL=1